MLGRSRETGRLVRTLVSLLVAASLAACASTAPETPQTDDASSDVAVSDQEAPEQDGLDSETPSDVVTEQAVEPQPVDPHALVAETPLSDDEIARAGGVDALFWVEPIPDAVFARMEGRSFGEGCQMPREGLRYVRVLHADAEGVTHVGELVVNASVADEVLEIFRELYDARYPIHRMHLVDDYGADDYTSCMDDNTSAFNWRLIQNTGTLSNHALGLAVDINTYENPYYIVSTGYMCPPDGWDYLDRDQDIPYMIHRGDLLHTLFTSRGWTWGGDWADPIDYQHFEKPGA